ncbi:MULTISPECIES: ParA family protein [unclassified Moraxella]|uniref:ParA family protein n=1 Tax=unclassified Moraxella TaxID=2685852 RepID=UPI003AF9520C
MLTRVIFNQKGGVGKSSIAVNLASISASKGFRTLLIDLDPQCNATQYLLGEQVVNDSTLQNPIITPNIETFFAQTLQTAPSTSAMLFAMPFGGISGSADTALSECIHATPFDNLSIIPASPVLGEILHQLESKHKIYKLREGLKRLSEQFDRVYIDTPPAFNFFTLSALISANFVVVPFDCDIFSKRALQVLLQNIIETRQDHNSELLIEGIIVNQYDPRANLPREVVQSLVDEGYPVLNAKLSPSVIMKESHHANTPLVYFDAKHKLTQQFVAVFDELEADN